MSPMIEVKVADLTGIALDWAVAAVSGEPIELVPAEPEWETVAVLMAKEWHDRIGDEKFWEPSSDWAQGGCLRDKYRISITELDAGGCNADQLGAWCVHGSTALVAICRCVVASAHGATVMVPAELVEGGAQ